MLVTRAIFALESWEKAMVRLQLGWQSQYIWRETRKDDGAGTFSPLYEAQDAVYNHRKS
jgi:hypothetical protein